MTDPTAVAPDPDLSRLPDGPVPQTTVWALRLLLPRGHAERFLKERAYQADQSLKALGFEDLDADDLSPGELRGHVRSLLGAIEQVGVDRSHEAFENANLLGEALSLCPIERELLALAVLVPGTDPLDDLLGAMYRQSARGHAATARGLAEMLGFLPREGVLALAAGAMLARSGLLKLYSEQATHLALLEISEGVAEALRQPAASVDELVDRLLPRCPEPELTRADLRHLGSRGRLVLDYVTAAVSERREGVNVCLVGPPGTGKTQLARLLGQAAGARAFEVAARDAAGEPLNRSDRFRAFLLAQSLLPRGGPALVVFDEIEDVFPDEDNPFSGGPRTIRGKAWTNRLLETNPVPAVWITNHLGRLDPAYVRRFDLVLEVPPTPRAVRRRVLAANLVGVPHSDDWLERVARDERATPADLARAARVARALLPESAEDAEATVEQALQMNLDARFGRRAAAYPHDPARFDLALLATSVPLASLVDTLRRRGRGSACLYGAPGTGKTAFAHQLAHLLERPILHRRASELLSKWLGETEQNLARMFAEARQDGAVLLLDEADSFLRDRRHAEHSWEVAQVNELLVQLEAFDGLFVAATNLLDDLDQAAFRRFDLKVRFDPLALPARLTLFERTLARFGRGLGRARRAESAAALARLEGLTPGDFRAVEGRFEVLGTKPTPVDLLRALEDELAVRRPTRGAGKVGFL
jgi:SpoVK/Ycf46/Vps4 family AAA+-type ATPase